MKFSDFICKEAIRTHLEADEKEAVIRAMATSLLEAGKIKEQDFESIVEAILKREELGSTGIGRGVAVPHTKHPVDRQAGRHRGDQRRRRRLRQPRRREGAPVVPVGFAARSAGRPLAGAGEHLAAAARRHVLPLPQAEQDAGRRLAIVGRSETTTSLPLRERRALSACGRPSDSRHPRTPIAIYWRIVADGHQS